MSLLNELKRRNVFKAAIAYIVVAWFVLQVADVVLNNITAPDWVFKVLMLFVAIGFPFVVIFAWAFEMTPEGLKREHEVDRSQSITSQTGKKLNVTITIMMALALGYFVFDKFVISANREALLIESTTQAITEKINKGTVSSEVNKSIAVLPFVNLSSDPEQEYFSDGISEELLNTLAKIPGLHVTSRSSAFAFKGKDINIPEVAKKLGVAHVLEGSVRKSGVMVRITAQLIEADSDKHLWSETYDRSLEDIFAVQDEISASIVEALVGKMGIAVEGAYGVQMTHSANTDAYTTYLLAQHQLNKRTNESYIEAKKLFEKAVEQDPDYAPALAQLATLWLFESVGYGAASVTTEEAILLAEPLIDRALELDPGQADAYAAKGLAMRYQEKNFDSVEIFKKALEINPSNSRARNWLSMAYRALLRSRDELETLKEGHRRDPLAEAIATNLVKSLSRFGKHDEAALILEKIKSLSLADYGFSSSEAFMLRGQYAEGIEAALYGEEAEKGFFLTLYMAAYLLAAMGEQAEAARLDPWQGGYPEFTLMLASEIRDQQSSLEAIRQINLPDDDQGKEIALIWAYLALSDDKLVEEMALERLSGLNRVERSIDWANMAMAILEWRRGKTDSALDYIQVLTSTTEKNLADGDNISLNHLIMAISKFIQGDESATFAHLKEGFNNKAPMSFEGVNVFAVYAALDWHQDPGYQGLLESWEARNKVELTKVFEIACGSSGFTVWSPLPESCSFYDPTGRTSH